jgi:hypothetical protein
MSGEATILPSVNEYQELAGFEIASPKNLDTFLDALQFQVRITPSSSIIIDQWFFIGDGAAPSPCESSQSGETITLDCTMSGGIPISIPQESKNTYRLGAHIISVDQTVVGSIEISVSRVMFNDGRNGFENNTLPTLLHYGVAEIPSVTILQKDTPPESISPSITQPAEVPTEAPVTTGEDSSAAFPPETTEDLSATEPAPTLEIPETTQPEKTTEFVPETTQAPSPTEPAPAAEIPENTPPVITKPSAEV